VVWWRSLSLAGREKQSQKGVVSFSTTRILVESERQERREKYHTDLSCYGWYDCEKCLCVWGVTRGCHCVTDVVVCC